MCPLGEYPAGLRAKSEALLFCQYQHLIWSNRYRAVQNAVGEKVTVGAGERDLARAVFKLRDRDAADCALPRRDAEIFARGKD